MQFQSWRQSFLLQGKLLNIYIKYDDVDGKTPINELWFVVDIVARINGAPLDQSLLSWFFTSHRQILWTNTSNNNNVQALLNVRESVEIWCQLPFKCLLQWEYRIVAHFVSIINDLGLCDRIAGWLVAFPPSLQSVWRTYAEHAKLPKPVWRTNSCTLLQVLGLSCGALFYL